jgi:hypothetical protein
LRAGRYGLSRAGNGGLLLDQLDEGLPGAVATLLIAVVGELSLLLEAALDNFERQEGISLLAQDPAQAVNVRLVELAITRRGALGVDQALALEEADLGDGHVGELFLQERQNLPYREMGTAGHGLFTPVPSV